MHHQPGVLWASLKLLSHRATMVPEQGTIPMSTAPPEFFAQLMQLSSLQTVTGRRERDILWIFTRETVRVSRRTLSWSPQWNSRDPRGSPSEHQSGQSMMSSLFPGLNLWPNDRSYATTSHLSTMHLISRHPGCWKTLSSSPQPLVPQMSHYIWQYVKTCDPASGLIFSNATHQRASPTPNLGTAGSYQHGFIVELQTHMVWCGHECGDSSGKRAHFIPLTPQSLHLELPDYSYTMSWNCMAPCCSSPIGVCNLWWSSPGELYRLLGITLSMTQLPPTGGQTDGTHQPRAEQYLRVL